MACGVVGHLRLRIEPEHLPRPAPERQKEWIELVHAKPVRAIAGRVRQILTPGTIAAFDAVATDGSVHPPWRGRDETAYPPNQIAWFAVRFPPTDFAFQLVGE